MTLPTDFWIGAIPARIGLIASVLSKDSTGWVMESPCTLTTASEAGELCRRAAEKGKLRAVLVPEICNGSPDGIAALHGAGAALGVPLVTVTTGEGGSVLSDPREMLRGYMTKPADG